MAASTIVQYNCFITFVDQNNEESTVLYDRDLLRKNDTLQDNEMD